MYDMQTYKLAEVLGKQCREKKIVLVTAESCTGGLIGQAITSVPGSSDWFDCGFITYSNKSKIKCLKVKEETIKEYGAVSQETANEMATGALKQSEGNISISITGIAGPSGECKTKPIGTVFFSIATSKEIILEHRAVFIGNREEIRTNALLFSLNQLLTLTL
jgi:nicotinamide-nucleotide amidase|tara:strand:+ start:44 stop:532 length:489 start_codon:yes stop_codon:yes gene_type:complete